LKLRSRWRDTKRTTEAKESVAIPAVPVPERKSKPPKSGKPTRVVKALKANGKPMTAEEAMLHFSDAQDYMVFLDAETNKNAVLVRRRDGKMDLIKP